MSYKLHLSGKRLCFDTLPRDLQDRVISKAKEKSSVFKSLADKGAVGIMIDGKIVTQEWVDQLDLTKPWIKRTDVVEVPEGKPKAVIQAEVKRDRRSELYALNRKEQFELLNKLGIVTKDVPGREKDRVDLIVKLEGKVVNNG